MKKNTTYILFIATLLLLTALSSCSFRPSRQIGRSFYYWKSVFELNHTDLSELKALQINRLYLKFFDLVWSHDYGQPIPVSVIDLKSKPPAGLEVVPVVFITVDALERLPVNQCQELARKINQKINSILSRNQLSNVTEIQLDCDWNDSTKLKYFTVLARLRELAAAQKRRISATIRLHQVKYASQTGIPPIDRGMLMFYNFDSPKRPEIKNSILDLQVGKEYTSALGQYPLELDLALPLFSWGVLFQDNRFQGLISDLRLADLENDPHFHRIAANNFVALADCTLKNIRIYQNNRIRVEESRFEECLASVRYLVDKLRNPRLRVALFHFDRNLIEGVGGREKINQLYRGFR
jgi:hypothetical protein